VLLSEALSDRKQALKEITSLEAQVTAAAVEYEDSPSLEDPTDLITQMGEAIERFRDLSVRINETNNTATIEFEGATVNLMQAIAHRESWLMEHRAGKRIAEAIEEKVYGRSRYGGRRTKDEIKQVDKLGLAELRKRNDEIAARLRRLDLTIQQKNWTTDLVD
jgi:hypothetical protein